MFFRVTQGQSNPPGVIRDLYTFTPALLRDYCRHRVKGEDYPAITPEAGQSVLGTYVTGLTEANLAKLDQFEGDEYEKRQVKLRLLTKVGDAQGEGRVEGEEKDTAAYVFLYLDRIERGEWDFEHFRRERLQRWARDEIFFADEGKAVRKDDRSSSSGRGPFGKARIVG